MISGIGLWPSFRTSRQACTSARTCILNSSGIRIPRRTPRRPSIGLDSCRRLTAAKTACWRGEISSPSASARAISALSSAMLGRNSCSGGSSRRMVTGSPDIAIMMPTKSPRCSGSISAMIPRCASSFSAKIRLST